MPNMKSLYLIRFKSYSEGKSSQQTDRQKNKKTKKTDMTKIICPRSFDRGHKKEEDKNDAKIG